MCVYNIYIYNVLASRPVTSDTLLCYAMGGLTAKRWFYHRLNTNRDWKRGGAAEIRRVMPQNGCISFERAITQHKNMKDTTNTGSYS